MPVGETELGVRATGNVVEVAVEEGEEVHAGELLVRLDDAEAQAAVAQARAAVAQAAVQLRRVRSVAAPLAREGVTRAEAEASLAERELQRAETLSRAGATTQAQIEATRHAVALARSRHREAEVALASAGAGGEEQRLAAASLAQAEAAVALAEARLEQTRIVAPADGLVLSRAVEPGNLVQPGKPLLVLARTGPTKLVIEPDEQNIASLALGQRATASTEAFPDRTFTATLAFIAPAVDPDRGTIEVHFEVDEPPDYLRANMTVSVEVVVGESEDALVVERRAIRDAATDAPWALVVVDGHAVKKRVTLGRRGATLVQITRGLVDGDGVVVDPAVRPGDRVRAREGGR